MKEVLDTVFYCILIVSVVGILFYLIIKESRDYRPFREKEGIIYDEDGNIRNPLSKNNPTTWDDYEKQLDKITSVSKEDLNIIPLNDEIPLILGNDSDEKIVGDDEMEKG